MILFYLRKNNALTIDHNKKLTTDYKIWVLKCNVQENSKY